MRYICIMICYTIKILTTLGITYLYMKFNDEWLIAIALMVLLTDIDIIDKMKEE